MSSGTESTDLECLILRARGTEEIQRLVALLSLGLCRALSSGAISHGYACARLFGPALLNRMERLDVVPRLRESVHLATELEDVSNLVPHALADSIQEIESNLLAVVRSLAIDPTDGERWLVSRGASVVEMPAGDEIASDDSEED